MSKSTDTRIMTAGRSNTPIYVSRLRRRTAIIWFSFPILCLVILLSSSSIVVRQANQSVKNYDENPEAAFVVPPMLSLMPGVLILCVLLLVGSAVAAGLIFWANRRLMKRVRAEGYALCPVCGYALRDLPDEHTCPECGLMYHLSAVEQVWIDWIRSCEFRWR